MTADPAVLDRAADHLFAWAWCSVAWAAYVAAGVAW